MPNPIYYLLILIISLPAYAQVTISSGSFSSNNLSSNATSQSPLSKSSNAINGLCENGIIKNASSILEFSENFTLKNHSIVQTDIPQYRSFSFGEIDPSIGGGVSPEIKAVGDLNNDGIDDLVIDFYETSVPPLILIGTSNGKFKKLKYDTENSARRHIRNGELADLNNDGWLDFIGFTTGDPGSVWIAEGYGTYGRKIPKGQEDIVLINIKGNNFRALAVPEVRKNDWNHGGTTADLDNDGFVDILPLSEGEKEFTVPLKNVGGKSFELGKHEYSKDISYYSTSDMDAGDINKDGFQDFVVAVTENRSRTPSDNNKIGTLRVIFGDGDFDFSNNTELKFGTIWLTDKQGEQLVNQFVGNMMAGAGHDASKIVTGTSNVELLDVDGDGYLDILEGQYHTVSGLWSGSGFKFYRYNNNGNCFEDATDKFFPNQFTNRNIKNNFFTAYIHNFRMQDINNDGLKDLVLQTDGGSSQKWDNNLENEGYPYIFINHDNKKFLPVKYLNNHFSALSDIDDLVPGDFNGDGKTDLLVFTRNKDQKLRVLLNDVDPSKHIRPKNLFNENKSCNFEFVRNQKNITNEMSRIADGSLKVEDGKVIFSYENWRTGLEIYYEQILQNESNIFVDAIGNYVGYLPIYPSFGSRQKQILFFDDKVKEIGSSSSLEREIHWINNKNSEIYFKISNCSDEDKNIQNNSDQNISNETNNINFIIPDDKYQSNLTCTFGIERFLTNEGDRKIISKGKFKTSDGSIKFFDEEWRTGGSNKNEKILDDEAELYVSSNGDVHGKIPIYTMFGDSQLKILTLNGEFQSYNNNFILEGENIVNIPSTMKDIELKFMVSNCNN